MRGNLEQIERTRKVAETELVESRDRANMLHQQNTSYINQKRKHERELQAISDEVFNLLRKNLIIFIYTFKQIVY